MRQTLHAGASLLLLMGAVGCADPVTNLTAANSPGHARGALAPLAAISMEATSTTGVRMLDLGINGIAYDINNDGVVVGSVISGQGWRWANGAAVSIGARSSGAESDARSINNAGDVAGWASNFIDRVAVVLPAGSETLQRVGAIARSGTSPVEAAREILDNGAVVGTGLGSLGITAAFFGNINEPTGIELGRLTNSPCTALGADLVQDGRIAIVGTCTTDRVVATVWLDGNGDGTPEARLLTALPGVSVANDIYGFEAVGSIAGKPYIMPVPTVSGPPLLSLSLPTLVENGAGAVEEMNGEYIVGFNTASDGQSHAVLWTSRGATPVDLGTLPGDLKSYAYAVTSSGVAVGYSENASGRRRAVIWYPGATPVNTAPSASITTPNDGASVVEGSTVDFTGTGLDPEDGTLGDAALSWSSSRDGVLGSGASLSIATLSVGTHSVTLTATDSDGATGTAVISVQITEAPNTAPVATILSPASDLEFALGSEISFSASADDQEDGALTGGALQWTSSLDGNLGTGRTLVISTLQAGEHEIRLTVTDADGATGTAAVTVHITVPNGLAAALARFSANIAQLVATEHLGPNGPAILEALGNVERLIAEGNLAGARGVMKAVVRGLLPASLRKSPLDAATQETLMQAAGDVLGQLGG